MADSYGHSFGIHLPDARLEDQGVWLEGPSAHATDEMLRVWASVENWREKGIVDFNLAISYLPEKRVRFVLTHPGQIFRKAGR